MGSNTYVDALTYSKAPTGLTLSSQVGNLGRLAVATLGATSLTTVAPLTVTLAQYDALYITDGPNSEVCQVGSGGAASGTSTIPLAAGTQFAHAGGTAYVTDGVSGSLGQAIFEASRWLEDEICHQALWQTAYTGEILTMPTMRAAIDNQRGLHFRPRHFPITTLSSVTVQANNTLVTSYDTTQAIIDSDQQTVDIPLLAALSSVSQSQSSPWIWSAISRRTNAWLTLSYTAGFPVGSMPWAVTHAATLLVSDIFTQLVNPVGADQIGQGKRNVMFMLRGDFSGDSLLVKSAMKYLAPYVVDGF